MKQKRLKDKKRNTLTTRNRRTAPSATYKPIKPVTKDYQKNNYDNQTENKDNNRNIDMSIGLAEEKKLKTKMMDQKEEKASSREVTTTASSPIPTSTSLPPLQSELFDSSSDNAMAEMKEVADMGPDETTRVFSQMEEKQQLDPLTSINDDIKNTVSENNPNTNSDSTSFPTMVDSILQERDPSTRELIEDDIMPTQNVKLDDNTQVYKESEKQDHLDESASFDGNANKESYSNSAYNDDNNPLIIGIRLWQAHNIVWINAYNEFMKAWN
jgi:hypothetical protein